MEGIVESVKEVLGVYREEYRKCGKIRLESGVGVFRGLFELRGFELRILSF